MTPRLTHLVRTSLLGALTLYGCAAPGTPGTSSAPDTTDAPSPPGPTGDTGTTDTTATGSDPATLYAERGAAPVGFATLELSRPGQALLVDAWYPARVDPGEDDAIAYAVQLKAPGAPAEPVAILGSAHRDAAPDVDGGLYPLVVFSHGFSMSPEWYPLAEHLASHGFVVLGPEHAESDWSSDVVDASVLRPLDVSDTIDLSTTGWLSEIVDAERVAVVGHSYGGYTALAAAGARFDLEALADRCVGVDDPFTAAFFCVPFVDAGAQLAGLMGLDAVPRGLWPSLADDRIDAIVPIAGDAYLFGVDGLASVQIPTMLIGGTADSGTPWGWGAGLAFDAISSPDRSVVSLIGAEHFVPVTSCENMPWTDALPEAQRRYTCEDPAWDKDEGLDVVHHFTTAFLLHTLADDPVARGVLDPDHYAGEEALDYTVGGAGQR